MNTIEEQMMEKAFGKKPKKFMIDHRDNGSLHSLYIKFAISGILAIDQAIKRIADEAKTSHCEILCAMYEQRKKLIREDFAYWEAASWLMELHNKGLLSKLGDIFYAIVPEEQ